MCLRRVPSLLSLWLVFGILSILSTSSFGQTTQLRGRVLDEMGAVIPGVSVSLRNQSTQLVREALSDEIGRYQFQQLPPGLYTLSAAHPGFKTQSCPDLRLEVSSPRSPLTASSIASTKASSSN